MSPVKIIQANPLSLQNTNLAPFKNAPNDLSIILKLDVFHRDRLSKLSTYLQHLQATAYDSDDIIKTMLENQETLDFADQRIQELLKEGVNLEQEMQIQQLAKQIVLYSQELQAVQAKA